MKLYATVIVVIHDYVHLGQDGHLKMLGGYLEFFMKPAVAEMYQCLRGELDDLIQNKVSKTSKWIVSLLSTLYPCAPLKSVLCLQTYY